MLDFLNTLFRYREKKSPDKLGLYPEAVHIEAMPERRYLWTSRVLVIFGCLSICISMMLASAIYVLLPQRGATPKLLQTNTYFSQLENVEPGEKEIEMLDLLTEQLLEKYIRLRHEIPETQAELMYRWSTDSEFYWLSSVGVYQSFSSKATADVVTGFIKQGLVRKVELDWTKQLTHDLWQIQFRTLNSNTKVKKPVIVIWRAYVRVKYQELAEDEREGLIQNPYGFKVTNYSLNYVGSPEKSDGYLETAKQIREQKRNM